MLERANANVIAKIPNSGASRIQALSGSKGDAKSRPSIGRASGVKLRSSRRNGRRWLSHRPPLPSVADYCRLVANECLLLSSSSADIRGRHYDNRAIGEACQLPRTAYPPVPAITAMGGLQETFIQCATRRL